MGSIGSRLVAIALVSSVCFMGYVLMSVNAITTPEYDLTIDNIPCNFDDDLTLYIDTETNNRAFQIYNDHLTIKSRYITFYDLNETYEHEDINFITGEYCYTTIPAMNLTLDTIRPIDRFQFHAYDGVVGVKCTEYGPNRMVLDINSTDDPTLIIRPMGLTRSDQYRIYVDGNVEDEWATVNSYGYFEYNYTGDWSNHTVQFIFGGALTEVPALYLNIIQTFLIMGVLFAVIQKMILPVKQKNLSPKQVTKNLIEAALFIVVGIVMIRMTFALFVGV